MLNQGNHTQVANYFIEMEMARLSGSAVKCFLAICRKTIGWHKETDYISISQLQEITGLSNTCIIKAIKELADSNLITKTNTRGCNKYTVNYLQSEESSQGSEESSQAPVKKVHSVCEESSHTKETNQKKLKETYSKEKTDYTQGKIQHLDHVYLSETELKKLVGLYGQQNVDRFIKKLDTYLTDHPQKQMNKKGGYKDHCKTIGNWMADEKAVKPQLYAFVSTPETNPVIDDITESLKRKRENA